MSVMVQIRNVPDDIHREFKVRAARVGMSLSDYLLNELRHIAERPTMEEFRERLRNREAVVPSESSADIIRAARDAR